MKADKIIITREEVDIPVYGITLLSKEEYKENKDIIPPIDQWWWLRSPSFIRDYAATVDYDGSLYDNYVNNDRGSIRPALTICNLKSSKLILGDKVDIAGYTWTVLRGDILLCDECVGGTLFRKAWRADDANDYDKSDIRQWLFKWAEENGIAFTMQTFSP